MLLEHAIDRRTRASMKTRAAAGRGSSARGRGETGRETDAKVTAIVVEDAGVPTHDVVEHFVPAAVAPIVDLDA
jgi:hypothetical protein